MDIDDLRVDAHPDRRLGDGVLHLGHVERALELAGTMAQGSDNWGIEHGVWSVLCNMYPEADVPVVMMSTYFEASAEWHFKLGQRLAHLCDEGVMILASGIVVHNLAHVDWENPHGEPWVDESDEAIRTAVMSGRFDTAISYQSIEGWEKAIPASEHYLPLLAALGAARVGDTVAVFDDYRELSSMSMTSYVFGA